jgi:hypothetical protein
VEIVDGINVKYIIRKQYEFESKDAKDDRSLKSDSGDRPVYECEHVEK